MPATSERITDAYQRLLKARRNECAVQVLYWNGELDHRLDEYAKESLSCEHR